MLREEQLTKSWYALQVLSGQEKNTASHLEEVIKKSKNNEWFHGIILPFVNVVTVKNGKRIQSQKNMWPRYVLISVDFSHEVRALVKGVRGVIDFLGGKDALALGKDEVAHILDMCDRGQSEELLKLDVPFKIGDEVSVYFNGKVGSSHGKVVSIYPEKSKAVVELFIFGRATSVEVDFDQIEVET